MRRFNKGTKVYPISRFIYISECSTGFSTSGGGEPRIFTLGVFWAPTAARELALHRWLLDMSQPVLFRSPLMALNDLLNSLKTYLLIFIREALSLWFIVVLEWACRLAEYALRLRVTYLTDVLRLSPTNAAAIVNGCKGAETILPMSMAFLADSFVGNYRMLLIFSSVAYSLGMSFLTMSTLSLLSEYAGILSCEDSPNCTASQRVLFYVSVPFIAIGISGHMVFVPSFIDQQEQREKNGQDDVDGKKPGKFRRLFRKFARFCATILLSLALSYISWSVQFGVPTIGMIVATLLFMSRSSSYKYVKPKPQGSPLTTISRVFVAAASKRICPLPQDDKLHENRSSSDRLPHTQGLRCLDKAAIVTPTQTLEQNRWRLCSVTEVEETKIFIRMIPIWMIFVMCGVVLSVGDTFFLLQANNLDVSVYTLLIFLEMVEKMLSTITKTFTKKGSSKYAAPIGMIIAMLFSIACFMIAAKVEKMRLNMIKSSKEMFWLLLPQFILLGALEGISQNLLGDFSIACFFKDKEVSNSIILYLEIFSDSAFGIGILGGIVPLYIVNKYYPSWFEDTLKKSKLDNYYWTLAVVSSINLVFSILVTIWYYYQHSASEDNGTPETQLPTVDNAAVAVA